jgi:hypothetical protein
MTDMSSQPKPRAGNARSGGPGSSSHAYLQTAQADSNRNSAPPRAVPPVGRGSAMDGTRRAGRPARVRQPPYADRLRFQAAGLLGQGEKLSDLLREAHAPGEAEQAEKRVRDALEAVLVAIDLSVSGLQELSGGRVANEYERRQWIDALTTVQGLDWSSLLTADRWHEDVIAAEAVGELKSCLGQLAGPSSLGTMAAEQARAYLLQLRAQVVAAQRETGEPSIARLTGVLAAMARIVRTIAIGLLAAAATGMVQGGGIVSQVLAAAVGLAVSAISAEACRIIRSLWHPPTVATLLEDVHHDLVYAVDDLSGYLRRLDPGSAPAEHDVRLVRDTQFAALASRHHAKYLAGALVWSRSLEYSACLDTIGDLLGQVPSVIASGNGAQALADDLVANAPTLAGFSIPANAPVHDLAPESLRGRTHLKGSLSHSTDHGETI